MDNPNTQAALETRDRAMSNKTQKTPYISADVMT